jgi:hypothetical protein
VFWIFYFTENENLKTSMCWSLAIDHFVTLGFLKKGNYKCNTLSNIILRIRHQMVPVMNSTWIASFLYTSPLREPWLVVFDRIQLNGQSNN